MADALVRLHLGDSRVGALSDDAAVRVRQGRGCYILTPVAVRVAVFGPNRLGMYVRLGY